MHTLDILGIIMMIHIIGWIIILYITKAWGKSKESAHNLVIKYIFGFLAVLWIFSVTVLFAQGYEPINLGEDIFLSIAELGVLGIAFAIYDYIILLIGRFFFKEKQKNSNLQKE